MSSSAGSLQAQARSLDGQIKLLINHDLKEICRGERLQVSGVKAALQQRITNLLQECVQSGDAARLNRIRYRIENHGSSPPPTVINFPNPAGYSTSSTNSNHQNNQTAINGYQHQPPSGATVARTPMYRSRFQFKDSPFYEIIEQLTNTIELPTVPSHRSTVKGVLSLTSEHIDMLRRDNKYKIMAFCAAESGMAHYAPKTDITFPQQFEFKLNGDEVRSNFKGLKNKPGTTRPADITDMTRKVANYKNEIIVTYALTQKPFHILINLVRKFSVEELTQKIQRGAIISKQRVLAEMHSKANDPDIVTTSTVMSLKDPISTLRIDLPCRAAVCTHNQCFDVSSFLQLQEQAPTWACPVCNKTVSFASLHVDQYVQEILQMTPKSVDQVTIEPDGKWSHVSGADNSRPGGGHSRGYDEEDDDYDSDDLVEVPAERVMNLKQEAISAQFNVARTPPQSSREASISGSVSTAQQRSGGTKRKSEVIDLTFSDEDDNPPAKRPAYGNTSNGVPNFTNGYRPSVNPINDRSTQSGVTPFRLVPSSVQRTEPASASLPHRPPSGPSNGYPRTLSYGGNGY